MDGLIFYIIPQDLEVKLHTRSDVCFCSDLTGYCLSVYGYSLYFTFDLSRRIKIQINTLELREVNPGCLDVQKCGTFWMN